MRGVALCVFVLAFVVAAGAAASAQVQVAVGYQQPNAAIYGLTAPVNECVAVLLVDPAAGTLYQVNTVFVAEDTTLFVAPPNNEGGTPVVPFFVYFPPTGTGLYQTTVSECPTLGSLSTDPTSAPRLWLTVTLGNNQGGVNFFISASQAAAIVQNNIGNCNNFGAFLCNGGTNSAGVGQALNQNNNVTVYAGFGGVSDFTFRPWPGMNLFARLSACAVPGKASPSGPGFQYLCM
jgi:hypothetical protein